MIASTSASGVRQHGADFIIRKHNSTYIAEASKNAGSIFSLSDSNLTTLINNINAIKSGPVIEFGAAPLTNPFVVDSPLLIKSARTVFRGQGPGITNLQASGSISSVIEENVGGFFYDISIENMTLDGASSATACLAWKPTSACTLPGGETYNYMLRLLNVHMRRGGTYSLDFSTSSGENAYCYFNTVKASGQLMRLVRYFDSMFMGGEPGSVAMSGGAASNYWANLYFGGGLNYNLSMTGGTSDYGNAMNTFVGCRFDNTLLDSVILDDYSRYNTFSGCAFTNKNQTSGTAATGSPIACLGNATHNVFGGVFIGGGLAANLQIAVTTGKQWAHPIDETESADYNHYSGIIEGARGTVGPNVPYVAARNLASNSVFTGVDRSV